MKTRNLVIALGMVSSLVFLACSGEDGADGVNGADGTSCYAKALKDSSGFELYCGDGYVGTLKNGEDGAKGDKGDAGDKGDTGASGENGRNGLNGENGKNGTSCTVEPLAAKDGYKVICAGDSVGVVLNGTNGTNGTNGKNGENGLSAYESAVANGFAGTEEEWLASLKGNPGADGKDGRNFDEDWMVDPRDRQLYKVVTIGEQTWMAHNLNYETDAGSYCYNDSAKYCKKYGRLYTWAAAMDSVGTWSTNGKGCGYGTTCSPTYPVRGVCPEGWHLPTKAEFETLFTAVGGQSTAGKVLMSTSGWKSSCNGSDDFAFTALPADERDMDGSYNYEGYYALFWSSTAYDSYFAYRMSLYCNNDDANLFYNRKIKGFSVRCLKD